MAATLYREIKGKGKPLVLLHGWGMHGGVWGSFADQLARDFELHIVDLPGYGFSREMAGDYSLSAYRAELETLLASFDEAVTLAGWSLGGLLALDFLQPDIREVDKVIFIASTPCFTRKTDWQCAMDETVFDNFASELQQDYKKTLKRFLALQTRGSEMAKEELKCLNKNLFARGEPAITALRQGLEILKTADLRRKHINTPALIIAGEKDTLVPAEAAAAFAAMFDSVTTKMIPGAGHAPFLSHTEQCITSIKRFIHEQEQ